MPAKPAPKRKSKRRAASAKSSAPVCVLIGGTQWNAPGFTSTQTKVCLTRSQRKRLFGNGDALVRPLACGSSACVFEGPDGTIIKLTTDGSDVRRLRRAQSTGVVPRLHDAFRLAQGGDVVVEGPTSLERRRDVFAARLERLTPLDLDDLDVVDRAESFLRVVWPARKVLEKLEAPIPEREGVEQIARDVRGGCSAPCLQAATEFVRLANDLVKVGIELQDITPGNFGIDENNKLFVLDLGEQGAFRAPPSSLETFAGARRRRTRQRLRPSGRQRSSSTRLA